MTSTDVRFSISPSISDAVRSATDLAGEDLEDFAQRALEERAEQVLRENQASTVVPAQYFDDLWAQLDEPPHANERLERAYERRCHEIRDMMNPMDGLVGSSGPTGEGLDADSDLTSELLDPDRHRIGEFSSGDITLDTWLHRSAVRAERTMTARTWVWPADDGTITGYYTLSAHKISRGRLPDRIGGAGLREIPAMLLSRVALAEHLHGQGMGEALVADAMHRVLVAARTVGTRVVVIDAMNEEVTGFYERLGFQRIPDGLLLLQRTVDVYAAPQVDQAPPAP